MKLRAGKTLSRVNKRRFQQALACCFAVAMLNGCSGSDGLLLLPRNEAVQSAARAGLTENSIAAVSNNLNSRKKVQVLFFNASEALSPQVTYTPLSTDNLVRLTFDGQFTLESDALQREAELSQSFQFLEPGAHVIDLVFSDPPQEIKIPLVVPDDADAQLILRVHLTFTPQGTVRDVQVGFDQNQDTVLDRSASIFRSSDGQNYLSYLPDGQVREWISPLNQVNSERVSTGAIEAPLPPGSEKDARNSSTQAPVPQTITGTTTSTPLPPVSVPPIPVPQPLPLPAPPLTL